MRRWFELAVLVGVVLLAGSAFAQEQSVSDEPPNAAAVHGVQEQGGAVTGVVTNQTDDVLREVRLLIQFTWLWADERNPGPVSPGRAFFYTIPQDIPPGGSVSFSYRPPEPLPERPDGRYQASAHVVGFTEVGW